jgi:hypothetical protein
MKSRRTRRTARPEPSILDYLPSPLIIRRRLAEIESEREKLKKILEVCEGQTPTESDHAPGALSHSRTFAAV